VTTNQRVSEWGTMFGDEVLATAILDRLLHHSHTLMITGESYRLREKRRSGLFRPGTPSSDTQSKAKNKRPDSSNGAEEETK
jgi:IstB-like ATP binding protein